MKVFITDAKAMNCMNFEKMKWRVNSDGIISFILNFTGFLNFGGEILNVSVLILQMFKVQMTYYKDHLLKKSKQVMK